MYKLIRIYQSKDVRKDTTQIHSKLYGMKLVNLTIHSSSTTVHGGRLE